MSLKLRGMLILYISATLVVSTEFAVAAPETNEINLINGQDWSHFAGADIDSAGIIEIKALDRKIRPKTNGKWYCNPSINLYGPRMEFTGDMSIETKLDLSANPDKGAYLDLYGTVPICYDEWRLDGKMLRIGVENGTLQVWANMERLSFSKDDIGVKPTVLIQRADGNLNFYVDGVKIGFCEDTVFTQGKVYFGADAEVDGGFEIESMSCKGKDVSVVHNAAELLKPYTLTTDSLRRRAQNLEKPFWIGTTIHANALLADPQYGKTLAEEFNMVTAEMDMKFQAIHPLENQYAWADADAIVEFANKNDMRFRGHCLVWHEALPQWVWDLYNSGNYPRLKKALMDHVDTVVSRYKGNVKEWDVLNEIFSDESGPTSSNPYALRDEGDEENNPSIWFKAFGPSIYVDVVKKVKEVDPNCEIWINEYGIDQLGSREKLENIAKFIAYVRSQGGDIDGVGFQCHNYEPVNDPSTAKDTLNSMKYIVQETGVKVHISELDVSEASKRPTLFSDKLEVCTNFTQNPNCRSLSIWGFTDKYGSMSGPINEDEAESNEISPNWGVYYSDSLIYNQQYQKRSAYAAMLRVLEPLQPTIIKIEAENGSYGGGAVKQADSKASGGQSIQCLDSVGAFNKLSKIDGGAGGTKSLTIEYAALNGNQQLSLYVNKMHVKNVVFKSTGGYSSYTGNVNVDISLKPGLVNTLELRTDSGDCGDVNIDSYVIKGH